MALLIVVLACSQAEPAKNQDIAKHQSLLREITLLSKKLEKVKSSADYFPELAPSEIQELNDLEKEYAYLLKTKNLKEFQKLSEKETFWSKVQETETLAQALADKKDKIRSDQFGKNKSLKSQKQFTIFPSSGSGERINPVFIECRSEGIIIHNIPGTESIMVKQDQIWDSEEYHDVLRQIKKSSSDSTAIFIIRPGAVKAYYKAHKLAKSWNVKNGKIPAPSMGEINFGMLTAALK